MTELFQAIEAYDEKAGKIVMTVLEGEKLAQKALVVDGVLVWESQNGGFFSEYKEEAQSVTENGVTVIGGHKVFCDVLGHEKHLVICGAGHVSIPVIRIGLMMGCEVTVLDDRPQYADHARRAGATSVICEPFTEGLDQIEGDSDTCFVIVTRGHRYDKECLKKIIAKEHAYIGMIGSRRRAEMVKRSLAEQGISREKLDTIYSPIGLDIGAETPTEIAVAIMAEIIEVKNKKKRTCGYSKEMIKALTDQEKYPGQKVLATIVTRRGSAPQGVGTKMLIRRDGGCIGTIGGGCMESGIIQEAFRMLTGNGPKAKICHVDMNEEDAEEEGMVCGGTVDVLLEVIEQV